jgi:hypothetical protein
LTRPGVPGTSRRATVECEEGGNRIWEYTIAWIVLSVGIIKDICVIDAVVRVRMGHGLIVPMSIARVRVISHGSIMRAIICHGLWNNGSELVYSGLWLWLNYGNGGKRKREGRKKLSFLIPLLAL